jgi:hypothetical protein
MMNDDNKQTTWEKYTSAWSAPSKSEQALALNQSVAEWVRQRCETRPTDEEMILAALTLELNLAVQEAKKSLKNGLDEAQLVLEEIRAKRANPT